jgi:hypothetical protein
MKLTNETMFASSIVIGLTGLLYYYMDLHRRIKTTERDINLILSTHLDYINVKDMHTTSIKNINNTLEAIALAIPFKGTGWQTPFIEAKIAREMDKLDEPPYYGQFTEDTM